MKDRLFWGFVCAVSLLATVTVSLLCLRVGLDVGVLVVKKSSLYFRNAPDWISIWIPDELLQNVGGLVSVTPVTIAVLAVMRGAVPTWFAQFGMSAFRSLIADLKRLWRARHPGSPRPPSGEVLLSLIKPGVSVFCAAFLVGSVGSFGTATVPSRSPITYVFAPDSMLSVLPIHPLVHFENAEIDASVEPAELAARGTALNDAQKAVLNRVVEALRPCAAPDRPVAIKPYGFASDDPIQIRGAEPDESDRLNVEAANRRARGVYDELIESVAPNVPGMTVEAPIVWREFDEMRNVRNSMIRVPEESERDPSADRVVLLSLTSTGACRSADSSSRTDSPEPTAGTDAATRSHAPAAFRSDFRRRTQS